MWKNMDSLTTHGQKRVFMLKVNEGWNLIISLPSQVSQVSQYANCAES